MKKILRISFTVLLILLTSIKTGAISNSFFPNAVMLNDSGYFDLSMNRFPTNETPDTFLSSNYLINNENVILQRETDLLLFDQSYSRYMGKSAFFLNICLMSGLYGEYTKIDNKSVNLVYSYDLLNYFGIGMDAAWGETSDGGSENFYSLQNSYRLFVKYSHHNIKAVLGYDLSSRKNFFDSISFLFSWTPWEETGFGLIAGEDLRNGGPQSYLNSIFNEKESSITAMLMGRVQEYLGILFYYRDREFSGNDLEFTMDVYRRFYFQLYISDEREAKRLYVKIPLYGNYTLLCGPEFYDRYYLSLSILDTGKKHNLLLGIKNSFKIDLRRNLSFFVKYRYLI